MAPELTGLEGLVTNRPIHSGGIRFTFFLAGEFGSGNFRAPFDHNRTLFLG
jgi:hypothetical protein